MLQIVFKFCFFSCYGGDFRMKLYIYIKKTENIDHLMEIARSLRSSAKKVFLSIESRRSFVEFDKMIRLMSKDDILVVDDLPSLGFNPTDISDRLSWFINGNHLLVISQYPTTYQYGIGQPVNKATLATIQLDISRSDRGILAMPDNRRTNSGRTPISYPDNWEELYDEWEQGKITSKYFLEQSGLKKATFYNKITQYKKQMALIKTYLSQSKRS